MFDLIQSQLTDPFRVGLLVALVWTMQRNVAATGRIVPLALGIVFVAVIIPSTMTPGAGPLWRAVAAGVVSNAIILAVILGLWTAVARFTR